jgi:hypothetical protein
MTFDFSFWDLALWFATCSLTMLVASEVLAPYFGRKNVLIDTKKLRTVAIIFSLAFIFTVGIRIVSLSQS